MNTRCTRPCLCEAVLKDPFCKHAHTHTHKNNNNTMARIPLPRPRHGRRVLVVIVLRACCFPSFLCACSHYSNYYFYYLLLSYARSDGPAVRCVVYVVCARRPFPRRRRRRIVGIPERARPNSSKVVDTNTHIHTTRPRVTSYSTCPPAHPCPTKI